jgi:anaerobic magnesium-protoporphyrin IX monomethyl ester cyclase
MKIAFIMLDSYFYERLGMMSLSSVAKQAGHDTRLFIDNRTYDDLLADLRRFDPALVCYTAMTGEHYHLLELNRRLKRNLSFFSVWGGPHATFASGLMDDPDVDAACVGEGEFAFRELLDRLEAGRDYHDVKNFMFRRNGDVVRNDLRNLIANLDELPYPDRDLFYSVDKNVRDQRGKVFMATRGCPYLCTYCFNHAYNKMYASKGAVLRSRSVDHFIGEVKETQRHYPLDVVNLVDDVFPLKPLPWLEELADRFPKEVGLPLVGLVRANVVNERNIGLMRKAGFESVWMGVETADEGVANEILLRNMSNEKILNAARIIKDNGIRLATLNIVGHPVPDPVEVDLKTLDFNIRMKPTYAWTSILCPYPGTQVAEYATSNGYFTQALLGTLPVTPKTAPQFTYPSKEAARRVERLHKIFGVVVRFPFLRRFVPLLIRLPLNRFYVALYWFWHGYNNEFVIRRTQKNFWRIIRYRRSSKS